MVKAGLFIFSINSLVIHMLHTISCPRILRMFRTFNALRTVSCDILVVKMS